MWKKSLCKIKIFSDKEETINTQIWSSFSQTGSNWQEYFVAIAIAIFMINNDTKFSKFKYLPALGKQN